jgi:hypothetical protein
MFKYYLPSLGLSMAILNMFNTTLQGDGKRRTNAVLELHMYGNGVNRDLSRSVMDNLRLETFAIGAELDGTDTRLVGGIARRALRAVRGFGTACRKG